MELFESILILTALAVLLLQVSRRLSVPYPAMLAAAGAIVAMLPWAPAVDLDPRLMLALFVAPALLAAAYDFPLRALRRHWLPLLSLAAFAVVITTAAVAWLGVAVAGLPIASAIALGAVVAPPDAAAATAVLSRFDLPRRTMTVLEGESLLNDATALLIFSAAVKAAGSSAAHGGYFADLALAAPGGVLLGHLGGRIYVRVRRLVAGTLGGNVLEFVTTFGVWILAERLHLSAILTLVAFGMTLAHFMPDVQSARDRVQSYAVWGAVVFLLNILAFLLLGLQARAIVFSLSTTELGETLGFAGLVLGTVILVRLGWVLFYNRLANFIFPRVGWSGAPTLAQSTVVAWCGMRGLVTLATALALPADMAGRDLIVLSAFAVVLGTLVFQGLTLGPLIALLRFPRDTSLETELADARGKLVDTGIALLEGRDDAAATRQRTIYRTDPELAAEIEAVRRDVIRAKRLELIRMRRHGEIEDDVFYALQEELDWTELSVAGPENREIIPN